MKKISFLLITIFLFGSHIYASQVNMISESSSSILSYNLPNDSTGSGPTSNQPPVISSTVSNPPPVTSGPDNNPATVLNRKNAQYILDRQINAPFGYLVDKNKEYPVSVDFSLLHSLAVTYSDNPLIWGLSVTGSEKIMNVVQNKATNYKAGVRFVIPGSTGDFLNRWGIDTWIFYKMAVQKDNLFGWTSLPFMKKESEMSTINTKNGVGADISFFSEPYYFNLYFSSSAKEFDNPVVMDKVTNSAYFSFMDFNVSTSFFWNLYELHRLKFDIGAGGYDMSIAYYDNVGKVTSHSKASNMLILPYAELQYTMETKLKSNQLFGCGIRFFDGHLKGNLWLQLIKESSTFPVNIRVESFILTQRVLGKDKEWETNEKSSFHVQLRARYGFNLLSNK